MIQSIEVLNSGRIAPVGYGVVQGSERVVPLNSNPGGYLKRTSTGGIKFILTSLSEERGVKIRMDTYV
jgi:hypothetical protein